jgi:CDP-paratose 2-epimerase
MGIVLVTGSGGLVGSEAARYYAQQGYLVIGIDNDMRERFFGKDASTEWNYRLLQLNFPDHYLHYAVDIRNYASVERIFQEYQTDISLIVHTAAQPSHDWAATDPFEDFTINANGTLVLLELTRRYCPEAVFIFTSTNKVYGDNPNSLPLVELETRWEIPPGHRYEDGIDETMSLDRTTHSLFGVSKTAADLMVQEYARYFNIKTGVFRGGCLAGPMHSGAQQHGFLAYMMKCAAEKKEYTIFGYKGKQVRDNIHSCDLVMAFNAFYKDPRPGEVYNIGGSRFSNCSVLEAVHMCEEITGTEMHTRYTDVNRIGDHIWWISDVRKFRSHYPSWKYRYTLQDILTEICNRLGSAKAL